MSLWLALWLPATAQDTIRYHIGAQAGIASENYLPHWLAANRYGTLDFDESGVGLLRAGGELRHTFTNRFSVEGEVELLAKYSGNPGQSSDFWLQQGYVRIRYGIFELTGGRWQRTLGSPDEDLSTGSLAISGNARPFTQLLLSVPEYSDVPFTRGWVQFKGTYGHGWLGEDRYIRGAFLHEKSFFARVGKDLPVNLSGGLIHLVVWAGEVPGQGPLPDDLKNYWQVIRGQGAVSNDPIAVGEVVNAAGDNIGVYDLGVEVKTKPLRARIYHQTLFEDGSGNSPFNGDRLVGIQLSSSRTTPWLQSFVYEFMSTKYQSGPSRPGGVDDGPGSRDRNGERYGGRDNYYNNSIYKSGWTYQDRIIGTPLFYTRARTRLYLPGFTEPERWQFNFNIVNNRVVAHHVGASGKINKIGYKLLATFTNNLGTYGGANGGITEWGTLDNPDAPYAFRPAQRQAHFLLEVESHPFSDRWSLLTSLAIDAGDLTNNAGVLIGLRREGMMSFEEK